MAVGRSYDELLPHESLSFRHHGHTYLGREALVTKSSAAFSWLFDLLPELARPETQAKLATQSAQARFALRMLDTLVREILPLSLESQGFVVEALELRGAAPLEVDASPSAPAAGSSDELPRALHDLHARLAARGMRYHLALGSTAIAVESLVHLRTGVATDVWSEGGALEMGLRRALGAGAPEAQVRSLLLTATGDPW